jgi:UDP-glucuronate 4-epimerase
MPRVLITGVAGFIGMNTAIRFLNEGWEVIGLDNMNDYYSVQLKNMRIDYIQNISRHTNNDFILLEKDLNSSVWNSLIAFQIDAVIHLAAQAGVRYSITNPRAYLESNILGFQNVIEFVEKQSINCFVYASSSSVYGKSSEQPFSESEACNQPESYYAATKKCNELMAQSYSKTKGINSIGLRFFTVYGPWGRPDMAPFLFADAAYKGEPIKVFNHGNQKRDFTYIDDVVEGLFLMLQNFEHIAGAEVLNIGFGAPTGLKEFISTIEIITERKLSKNFVEAQVGDVDVTYASIEKLGTKIGFSPKTSLNEGIKKFVEWYRSYYNV